MNKTKRINIIGQLRIEEFFVSKDDNSSESSVSITAKASFDSNIKRKNVSDNIEERIENLNQRVQRENSEKTMLSSNSVKDDRCYEISGLTDDEIVIKNMSLIKKIARETVFNTGADASFDFDDLVQIGCISLVKAAKKYDGTTAFSTFAYVCVRNAIRTFIKQHKNHMDFSNRVLMDDENIELAVDNSGEMYERFSEDCEEKIVESSIFSIVKELYASAKPATKRNIEVFLKRLDGTSIEDLSLEYDVDKEKISTWIGEAKRFLSKQEALRSAI